MILDHILWAAPDVDAGTDLIGRVAGVVPAGGGAHPGFGTRNQLLSLGDDLFFEVIGPDPAQAESGKRASAIAALTQSRMHTFSMRSDDLSRVAAAADAAGIGVRGPVAMSRTRADGVRLEWRILYFDAPEWGDCLPFVIDWQGSPHPAGTAPKGCSLAGFEVLHPRADDLARVFGRLGIEVTVSRSPMPGFVARLATPNGEVVLT